MVGTMYTYTCSTWTATFPITTYNNSAYLILIFSGPTHHILNVCINTRGGKEVFHNSRMTSLCCKV